MNAIDVQLISIVPRLGWTLVHSVWQGVLAAALLAVMLRMMSGAAARWRYVVSCSALAAVLLSAVATYELLGTHPLPEPMAVAANPIPQAPVDVQQSVIETPIGGSHAAGIDHEP